MEFLKENKKKILVLAVMVILLVATGVLNWALTNRNTEGKIGEEVAVETFFVEYRNVRTTTRAESVLYLDAIIASETSSAEAKTAAETQKLELIDRMEKEFVIEGLIKAKGFSDAIVTMSDSGVTVVVYSENVGIVEAAQITNVVATEIKCSPKAVKIIPY